MLPRGKQSKAPLKVLILGGTTEGRLLAAACAELPDVVTVSSLAGRTNDPIIPAGELRIGGFGGVEGLVAYLRAERIDAIVDATHTFARRMTGNACAAAGLTGVPLLILRRPGWTETAGDAWHRVPDLDAAAELLPRLGRRVFLTTGRQEIGAFAALDELWFLARSVEPPEPPMPRRLEVLLDRGPFTVAGERELLAAHRIDVLVSKDSGGAAAKLTAARELGVPVVLIDRPEPPPAPMVATVPDAVAWLIARTWGTAS
ncbi:cobalt-precorrin-6A reductase [Actinoplanes sp. NBRC 103695]|uniref:cobalt-precorrin-6A reductase n=1 Tax=Actinoplanes sp. NBRC 103695 TaxID=3032202 RepID=UPI00249FE4BF|nr:cobalt-precorrin-6A reductase [Actinoplanes sp. NBRC 103695]GLY97492.1 precorrin-6A reductase [Actinoplanes sp. NBRC 103695]